MKLIFEMANTLLSPRAIQHSIFTILFLFFGRAGFAQSFPGVYTDTTRASKQTDSLILYADSTYRYAFYYPKYGVSEYYTGKWTYANNRVVLLNAGLDHPAFQLAPTLVNGNVTQLEMTEAKLRKRKKGQVLQRN